MNEEVLKDLYNRAVSSGYKKSINEFQVLLSTNKDVFEDSYGYVKSKGFTKGRDAFAGLVGSKKKETTELPSGQPQTSGSLDMPEMEAPKPSVSSVTKRKVKDPWRFNSNIESSDAAAYQKASRDAIAAAKSRNASALQGAMSTMNAIESMYGDTVLNDSNLMGDKRTVERLAKIPELKREQPKLKIPKNMEIKVSSTPLPEELEKQLAFQAVDQFLKRPVDLEAIDKEVDDMMSGKSFAEKLDNFYDEYISKPMTSAIMTNYNPAYDMALMMFSPNKSRMDLIPQEAKINLQKSGVKNPTKDEITSEIKNILTKQKIDERMDKEVASYFEGKTLLFKGDEQNALNTMYGKVYSEYDYHIKKFEAKKSRVDDILSRVQAIKNKSKDKLSIEDAEELSRLMEEKLLLVRDLEDNYKNIESDYRDMEGFSKELDRYKRNYTYATNTIGLLVRGGLEITAGLLDMQRMAYDAGGDVAESTTGASFGENLLSKPSKMLSDYARSVSKDIKDSTQKAQTIDQLSGIGDWASWAGTTVVEQSPQLALTYLTGGASVYLLGASAAGNKYSELEEENKKLPEGEKKSRAQIYAASIGVGLFEGLSEKVELDVMRSIFPSMRLATVAAKEDAELLKRSLRTGMKGAALNAAERTVKAGVNMNKEGASELIAQTGGNLVDKFILGEDVNILDGVPDAYLSGAVVGGAMTISPFIASAVVAPFNYDPQGEVKKNVAKINELAKALELVKNDNDKAVITTQINKLLDKNQQKITNTLALFDSLSIDEKKRGIEIVQELAEIKSRVESNINDPTMPKEVKNEVVKALFDQYNELVKERTQLLNRPNAVQEQTTSEVPVQPEARVGEEVAQGESQAGPEVAAEEVKIDRPSIVANAKSEVDVVVSAKEDVETGQTFNMDGTVYSDGGLVVPVVSENLTQEELTPERIADFLEANKDKIGSNAVKVGIYKFPGSNRVSIDLNIVVPKANREAALEFGRAAGQESLFDLDTFENVKTGADGKNPSKFTPQQFVEISKALEEGRVPDLFQKQQERTQKATEKVTIAQNVSRAIQKLFPKLKTVSFKNAAEMRAYALKTYGQEIGSQVTDMDQARVLLDGKNNPVAILLNEELSDATTMPHEAWHPILLKAFGDNQALFEKFRKSIDRALREAGYEDVADRLDIFASDPEYIEKGTMAEEWLVQFGGMLVSSGIDPKNLKPSEVTLFEKIKSLFNEVARKITGQNIFLEDATPETILDFMVSLSDMMSRGEDISGMVTREKPGDSGVSGETKSRAQVIDAFNGVLKKLGIDVGVINQKTGKTKVTNYDIAAALNQYYEKVHKKLSITDFSDDAVNLVSDYAKDEILFAMSKFGSSSGKGWYTDDYAKALNILSKLDKDISKNKEVREIATAIIAVASNSTDVYTNLTRVIYGIDKFKATRKVPTDVGVGKGASAIASGIDRYNNILDKFNNDPVKVAEFLQQIDTISNLKKKLVDTFNTGSYAKAMNSNLATDPEWNDSEVLPMSILIFGPKIGAFYSNLSGLDGTPTIDRWCIRTVYRYRGDMRSKVSEKEMEDFKQANNINGVSYSEAISLAQEHSKLFNAILTGRGEYKGIPKDERNAKLKPYRKGDQIWKKAQGVVNDISEGIESGVSNKKQYAKDFRTFTKKAFESARDKVFEESGEKLSVSDVQAILWIYEKNLFGHLGVKQREDSTYSAASLTLSKKVKSGEISIDQLKQGDLSVLSDPDISTDGAMGDSYGSDVESFKDGVDSAIERNGSEAVTTRASKKEVEATDRDFVLPFGKYEGKWFTTTPPAYRDWLRSQPWFDIRKYLKPNDAVTTKASKAPTEIEAYHRSSAKFSKFKTSSTSTDSNRHRYGYGLYFSSNPPINEYGENLYKVKLFKGKEEYRLINTKEPVDKIIVNKIAKALSDYNKKSDEVFEFSYNGWLFYKTISRILGGDKKASLFLSENGVDGLKINQAKNLDDYVLFNEGDIDIEEVNGKPRAVTTKASKYVPERVEKLLTEDGNGNFVFHHYSFANRDAIKPSTGDIARGFTSKEEAAALSSVGGLAMYYAQQDQVEAGVGPIRHTVVVPKDKVYYMTEDPLNFYDEAKERFLKHMNRGKDRDKWTEFAFNGNYQVAWISKVAAENGFDMVLSKWRNDADFRAQTVKTLKPIDGDIKFKDLDDSFQIGDLVKVSGRNAVITDMDENGVITYKSANSSGKFDIPYSQKSMRYGTITMIDKGPYTFNEETKEFDKITTKASKVSGYNTIPGYDRMRDELDNIIKKAKSRGADKQRVYESALAYVQKSAVYERADDTQREQMTRDLAKELGIKGKSAPSVDKILGTLSNKKTSNAEKKDLVQWIKDRIKAAKDATDYINSLRRDLQLSIAAQVKSGKITSKQAASLIKAISTVNLQNPSAVSKLIDYANRVFERADYTDKLAEANRLRKRINKARKSKDNQAAVSNTARNFVLVDPKSVEDIDDYISMANKMLEAVMRTDALDSGVKTRMATDLDAATEYIRKELKAQEEIKKQSLLIEYQDLVDTGVIDDSMSYDEIMSAINALEPDQDIDDADKKQAILDFLTNRFESLKQIVGDMIDSRVNPIDGQPIDVTDEQVSLMKKLMDINFDELSTNDKKLAVEYLDNFASNEITDGVASLIEVNFGISNANKLVEDGYKSRSLKLFWSSKFGRRFAEQLTSLPMLIERMFGSTRRGMRFSDMAGINRVVNGVAAGRFQAKAIMKEYKEKFLSRKGFNEPANTYERGIGAFLMRTDGTPTDFARRMGLVKQTIERLSAGTEIEQKKAEAMRAVFDKFSGAKNIDDVRSAMSQENLDAVNWWIQKWSENYDALNEVSRTVYNSILGADENYTPDTFTKVDAEGGDSVPDKIESAFRMSTKDYTVKKKTGVLMEVTKPRLLPTNMALSFDFDYNNSRAMEAALIDINTAGPIRQVYGFINSKAFAKMGKTEDMRLLKARINSYIGAVRGKDYVPASELKSASKAINALMSIGAARALGGITQPIKQTVPVAVNTLINAGRLDISAAFDAAANAWINRSGMPIANRGLDSLTEASKADRYLEQSKLERTGKAFELIQKAGEFQLKVFLSDFDSFIARASFISYYKVELKKLGENPDGIDWTTHKPNQKALDFAQAMVDRQQNITDSDLAGDFMRSKDPLAQITRSWLFSFMNFVMNQKNRIYNDTLTMSGSMASTQDKTQAARSLSAAAAEMFTFAAVTTYIGSLLANAAYAALGFDEPEEEKEKRLKYAKMGTATNFVNDLLSPLPITNGLVDEGINKALVQIYEKSGTPEESRLYLFEPNEKTPMESLGAAGIPFVKLKEAYDNMELAATGKFEKDVFGKVVEKQLKEEDLNVVRQMAFIPPMYSLGLLPVEINNINDKVVRIAKKRASSTGGSGGGSKFKSKFKSSFKSKFKSKF